MSILMAIANIILIEKSKIIITVVGGLLVRIICGLFSCLKAIKFIRIWQWLENLFTKPLVHPIKINIGVILITA